MSTPPTRRVSHSDILGAPNARQLMEEYAAECSVPDAEPQAEIYQAMEQAGVLQCFGAYAGEELIGFASVVSSVMPHHGKRAATIESIFVLRPHRSTGAGAALLGACELYADEIECIALTYTPRIGSALDKVLSRRPECIPTHRQYTRWL